MDDLPQPPSPQMVMEMGMGGVLAWAACEALEAPRARGPPAPAVLLEVPAEEGILVVLRCGRSRGSPVAAEVKVEGRCWEEDEGVVGRRMESRTRSY